MSLETLTQEYLKARKAFDSIAVASSAWSGDPKVGFLRNKIAHAGPCVTNPCASCPNAPTMTVVLSGISFPCGCIDGYFGGSFTNSSANVNGTYVKNLEIAIPNVETVWDLPSATGTITTHNYQNPGCSVFLFDQYLTLLGGVFCFFPNLIPDVPNGGIVVFAYSPPLVAFFGVHQSQNVSSPLVIPNMLTTCGQTVPQPSGIFGAEILAVGIGGTAVVSF